MAVPKRDPGLVPYSSNFNAKLVASGESVYQLTPQQIATCAALHASYLAAVSAVRAALAQGVRSMSLTAEVDDRREALLPTLRALYATVQANPDIPDAAKVELGVKVPQRQRTPAAPPAEAPQLRVTGVTNRVVTLVLRSEHGRARPAQADGALILSSVGEEAPRQFRQWALAGHTGGGTVRVPFAADLPPGTCVWLTAMYYNRRKASGPMATPVSAHLDGGVSKAA